MNFKWKIWETSSTSSTYQKDWKLFCLCCTSWLGIFCNSYLSKRLTTKKFKISLCGKVGFYKKPLKRNIWTYKIANWNLFLFIRLWNLTFQCTSLFRLAMTPLLESPESIKTCIKHNCVSLCNIVKEQITKTWFRKEMQE